MIDIFEVIERNWEVKGKSEVFTKPKTTGLMFTAFVVIFRKIGVEKNEEEDKLKEK